MEDHFKLSQKFIGFTLSKGTVKPRDLLDSTFDLLSKVLEDIDLEEDNLVVTDAHAGLRLDQLEDIHIECRQALDLYDSYNELLQNINKIPKDKQPLKLVTYSRLLYSEIDRHLGNTWNSIYHDLTYLAPNQSYFGSHEGNGTLLGFWKLNQD